jgi:predicted histidine transporter YuiF (NhaC family)
MLRLGPDKLAWRVAARTAWGMSFASMVAMELAENAANYALTHGVVAVHDWRFWLAGAVSMLAGFLVPLPYNYARLRKYSKACH